MITPYTDTTAYDNISFVLTSCGRFDLLKQTVESMKPWIYKFPQKILIEDSGKNHEILEYLKENGFLILINQSKLGQLQSIDKAYSYTSHPYIFHCEDDWSFTDIPDLDLAKHILDINPKISQICFRNPQSCTLYTERAQHYTTIYYKDSTLLYPPFDLRKKWKHFGFVLNPHLIRKYVVEKIYPYASHLTEGLIAYTLQQQGYNLVIQSPGNCVHIGDKRHVVDPYNFNSFTLFSKLLTRLKISVRKSLIRLRR